MAKTVHLEYFALLRDQRGQAAETLHTDSQTVGELYDLLARQYHFTLNAQRLKAAINDEFAAWNAPLKDGDRVVFIPPVAGG